MKVTTLSREHVPKHNNHVDNRAEDLCTTLTDQNRKKLN